MKINNKTKWIEFAPFATRERIELLMDKVSDVYVFNFWGMTIGDFAYMIENGMPEKMIQDLEDKKTTVFQVASAMNACKLFVEEFEKVVSSYSIPQTQDEERASIGLPEFSIVESMLLFCQEFFGHSHFGESENITLLEYNLARKKSYSNRLFQKNMHEIEMRKIKSK